MVDGTIHAVCEQDAVEELATDPPPVMERLRPTLRDLKDLDPAIASLHHRRIQPSRLLSLLGTMRKVCIRNGGAYGGAKHIRRRARFEAAHAESWCHGSIYSDG